MAPGFWVGAGIAAAVLFPGSTAKLLPFFVPTALGFSILAWSSLERTPREAFAFLIGVSLGAGVAFSQQAPAPSTQPSQTELRTAPENLGASSDMFKEGDVSFDPAIAKISIAVNSDTTFELQPLLSFHSRSPDRCWTCLANSWDRQGPRRRLLGGADEGAGMDRLLSVGFLQLPFREYGKSKVDHFGVDIASTEPDLLTSKYLLRSLSNHTTAGFHCLLALP